MIQSQVLVSITKATHLNNCKQNGRIFYRDVWLSGANGLRVLDTCSHLLESEELDDGQVDGGVQAETTLVGTQCAVELDAVPAVHLSRHRKESVTPLHGVNTLALHALCIGVSECSTNRA